MKLSNYIFSKLVNEGIDTVFVVTGGGAMHLNDAIGRTPGLKFVCPPDVWLHAVPEKS